MNPYPGESPLPLLRALDREIGAMVTGLPGAALSGQDRELRERLLQARLVRDLAAAGRVVSRG